MTLGSSYVLMMFIFGWLYEVQILYLVWIPFQVVVIQFIWGVLSKFLQYFLTFHFPPSIIFLRRQIRSYY